MTRQLTRGLDSTARSGRLRCNGRAHFGEADNQIAAPDRTDLSMHRLGRWAIKSANGSLAEDRSCLCSGHHVGLDRSKLLMEAVADRPSFRFATLRLLNGKTVMQEKLEK